MRKLMVSLLAVLLTLPACATNVPKKLAKSTVLIHVKIHRVEDNRYGWGTCSGVYIKDNVILSAAHCVNMPEGVELKEIWIKQGEESERASIVKIDTAVDLLLLYTPLKGTPVKFAKKAIRGEDCWVIGNPLGLIDIVTKGIVSKINFTFKNEKATFLVVDASVLPGNSGGCIINRKGQLIGILTRSTSLLGGLGAAGLGFGVDLRTIKEFLK